jgi:hypothetical protein
MVYGSVGEEQDGEKERGWNLGLEFEDLTNLLVCSAYSGCFGDPEPS